MSYMTTNEIAFKMSLLKIVSSFTSAVFLRYPETNSTDIVDRARFEVYSQ
jgi:hypothetical protein